MLPRYKTKENRKVSEKIYKLRQKGHTYQAIADKLGQHIQTTMQKYKRECRFREQAFHHPFIEYISGRTEKVIRMSLGEAMLSAPEESSGPEAIRTIFCWPGVGAGVLEDLAEGLAEAGYESFEVQGGKGAERKKAAHS